MANSKDNNPIIDQLSTRELEILGHVAKGSSDREIAQALFLSLNTIKWHNRQIYNKLGVPNRRQAVALAAQAGLLKSHSTPTEVVKIIQNHNLPAQITSFIGRQQEIEKITSLLDSTRLLTLTGPGGVGKTRLSLQVANSILDTNTFQDGTYFVDLAPLQDPIFVANTIIDALRIPESSEAPPIESLKEFLHTKPILLILDNFEHILEAAPILSELLKASPNLTLLVTSRESLQLSGEHVYPVPPLELNFSVELFQQRALAAKHDFKIDDTNKAIVKQISTRLDGIPLAIELAAARIVLFSPQALLPQLENRLNTLNTSKRDAPQRQQTLRATLDWSYDLLNEDEKTLFNRLGIFVGGCSLEAADVICSEPLSIDLFEGLEALLNKSLLSKEEDWEGESRFTMLETLREYALEKLVASQEFKIIQTRHAEYYASLAEQAELALKNLAAGLTMWSKRIDKEFENLRSAFNGSMAGDILPGFRILNALDGLWWYTHRAQQGRRWIDQALDKMKQVPLAVQAKTLITACMVASTGDWELSRKRGLEAVALLRQLDDKSNLAFVLGRLGVIDLNTNHFETADAFLTESLKLYEQLSDYGGASYILNAFGELMRQQKRYEEAKTFYEDSITMHRKSGMEEGSASLYNLANIERHLGNDTSAYKLYIQALEFGRRADHTFLTCAAIFGLAGIIAIEGNPLVAARLLGVTEAILEANHHTIQPTDQADYDRSKNEARALLDEETFLTAWAEGRALSLEEAVQLAKQNHNN